MSKAVRRLAAFAAIALLAAPVAVRADATNPMGYRLLTADAAAQLPHNHGVLGMKIERAQQITDQGLSFDLIRVMDAPRGSPGGKAGFKPGDQIIAVDGQVFPSIAAFAAYVGSIPPDGQISVDYLPAGGGPQQAQRVSVVVGGPGAAAHGLSRNEKIAIGAGAIALFGCYEMGCFSHHHPAAAAPPVGPPGVPPPVPAQNAPSP